MQEQLPITINSVGVFERDEQQQAPLFVKLEAWFNFQALTLNWYSDESKIHSFAFVFIADNQIDKLQVDSPEDWTVSQLDHTQVLIKPSGYHTDVKFILANADLKQMMDGAMPVERFFRAIALTIINQQAVIKQLKCIPNPDLN
ncbi:hypothetical protein KO525_03485 [Psychrosphaera sp. B3R10]|uniref:hypothetical protein n=1 Tax=unclassified Psychrosphaera TaxID=2641570 RepID=UPI001C08D992|nr:MULTISPECIES: hypothetical protein [unclassified Psychrosphaera]MBU2881339.1 hypothetical protein [Psychrosphaera sp. I2R16]MBU2988438.1 hypothetical protein [Psychrosphaera sp. B3R10]MDO6720062.1 hypothetical protein [Psychrosphaera sp. 1_MG-2023]